MRTLCLPTLPKRLSTRVNRWLYRIPNREEKNIIENHLDYVGNEPFWFDGGSDGNIASRIMIGRGNGKQLQYHLPNEFVFAPSLVVYINGCIESKWKLDEHAGLLTFDAPPPRLSQIEAKYRCRFKCIARRRDTRTIEIREVGPLHSYRHGRTANADGARQIIAEFLNFEPGIRIEYGSSLYWLLHQTTNSEEIQILHRTLRRALEPIIAPKVIHDPRTSLYVRSMVPTQIFSGSPKGDLRLNLEKILQRSLIDGKLQTLRSCESCMRLFVAKHARSRVCSKACQSSRDKQQQKIRQCRYLDKKRSLEKTSDTKK